MTDQSLARVQMEMAAWFLRESKRGVIPPDLMAQLVQVVRAPAPEATALLAELYRTIPDDLPEHLLPAAEHWNGMVDGLWTLLELRMEWESLPAQQQALAVEMEVST